MSKIAPPLLSHIPLNRIENHKEILERYHLLEDNNYLLKSPERITPSAVQLLLTLHPIMVTTKRNRFFCIGGIRQLNIASIVLGNDALVPVHIFKGLTDENITELCLADLFLTPLSFSINNARTIDEIRQTLGDAAIPWSDLATCTKNQLAEAFGLSPAALYYDRKLRKH